MKTLTNLFNIILVKESGLNLINLKIITYKGGAKSILIARHYK